MEAPFALDESVLAIARGPQAGLGFLTDAQWGSDAHGTLAAPKAGLSPDLDALAAYVESLGDLDVPDTLAAAALRGLDSVLAQEEPAREAALQLLAADASLTYAFEAAASIGTNVEKLALRIGPSGELGR